MELKVCVLGCGQLGQVHARTWPQVEGARVLAVADPLEELTGVGEPARNSCQATLEPPAWATVKVTACEPLGRIALITPLTGVGVMVGVAVGRGVSGAGVRVGGRVMAGSSVASRRSQVSRKIVS